MRKPRPPHGGPPRGDRDRSNRQRPDRNDRPKSSAPPRREFGRDDGRKQFEQRRDDRPARAERDRPREERHAARNERPQRDIRPERSERPQRDNRPERSERPQRDSRPEHRAPRGERPSRDGKTGERTTTRVETWGDKTWGAKPERGNRPFRPGGPRTYEPGAKPLFRSKKGWRPPVRDKDGPVFLYGWHSVKAALENPARKFIKIMATENALHRLQEENITLPVEPELVRAEAIDALVGPDAVHQGLLVEADPLPSPDIDEVAPEGIILVLDQVTDPHNVGAILRTAAAFGVTAIVTTQRHSPEATGVLAKAASGALDLVPMVSVTNLARALESLKKNNVFVIGLDSEGDGELSDVPMRAPLALVIGAEGKGLRQLTRATCDAVARLDLPGKIKSLNVSNATALALYVAASRIAREA